MGRVILTALGALGWFYALMPYSVKSALARTLGTLIRASGLRAKVVRQNLEFVFRENPEIQRRLFKSAYEHLGQLVWEILMLPKAISPLSPMKRYVLRNVDMFGVEHWQAAKKLGKGVIFLSSHVGNWEIMSAGGALHAGMDLMLVTKHIKPEWLHQAIEAGRKKCGVLATYEPKTLKDVLSHLKKNGTVGFVLDQYVGPPVGIRVPVFGIPVGTPAIVATLAKRTGASVLPVVNYRTNYGRFRVEIRPPMPQETSPEIAGTNPAYETALNTACYARELEKDVLAHPEQWLWIHRRFKGDLSPLRDNEWREGRART